MFRKLSTALLILACMAVIGYCGWIFFEWQALARLDGVKSEDLQSLFYQHLSIAIAIFGVALLGYLSSFNARLAQRPYGLLLPTAFLAGGALGIPIREALGAWEIVFQLLPSPDWIAVGLFAGCGLAVVAIVLLFEMLNRALWQSLATTFDKNDLASLALLCNQMSLLFRPGQMGMLKSVALARFRKGNRGDSVEVLASLHQSGKADPDILECLCKHASEQHDKKNYILYLTELYNMVPVEEDILEALLDEMIEQNKFTDALALIEKTDQIKSPDALERYAGLLLTLGRIDKAAETARKLGEMEGIPFRRSQTLLREILSRHADFVPALNTLAAQADRMALRDQKIRWLEKSFEVDSRQKGVRDKLIVIYRELGQSVRLEELLSEVVQEHPGDLKLLFEYIQILYDNEKTEQALSLLEKLNRREEAPFASLFLEAKVRFDAQNWDDARELIEKALARDHTDAETLQAESLLDRIEKAVLTVEVANILTEARANPDDIELQLMALSRLIHGGHADKVLGVVDQILSHHSSARPKVIEQLRDYCARPDVPFTILNLQCDLLANTGQFEEALQVIQKMADRAMDKVTTFRDGTQRILRRAPHHLATLKALGDIYLQHGKFTEMIHSYSLYLSHGGEESEQIVRALTKAYLSLQDYTNAKRFVNHLLEINPRDNELLKQVLPLALDANEPEDAAEYFKKLQLIDPRDPDIKRWKTKVDTALGERRFSFLKRELEAGKGGSETLEKLGDIARDLTHYGDAITYYQRATRDKTDASLARRCTAKLAYCYMKKRLHDLCTETLRDITISLDDDPQDLAVIMDLLYEIGEMMIEYKFFDRAEKVFKQLCRIDAGYRDVLQKIESLRR